MSFRTTLILLLVLIGLGTYIHFVERPAIEEEERGKKLLDSDRDDVVHLHLRYADREMELARTEEGWKLEKPLQTRADTSTVNSLISALTQAEVNKELEAVSENLESYGLATPLVTVEMRTASAALPPVSVGKDTPFGSSTYVRRGNEDKVLITGSTLRYAVDKQIKDLRDKTIVGFEDDDVQAIEVRGVDKRLRLTRTDGEWNLVEPAAHKADQGAVRSYLSSLRSMRATDFAAENPDDLAPYGLDEPRLTVKLALADAAETEVHLGDEAEESKLYARVAGQPTVYMVSDYVFGNLDKGSNDLRDKTLLAFESESVTAVRITRRDGTVTELTRGEEGHWAVAGAEGEPQQSVIDQYVDDLQQLKGYEIAADDATDLAEFGLDSPVLRLQISGAGEAAAGTIWIGKTTDGEQSVYAAMTEGGRTVFRVRDYLVTRLDKPHTAFVETSEKTAAPPEAGT